MSHRDPRIGRRGNAGRHSGNYFEAHACIRERLRLLAPSSEHERVATFKPHDAFALASVIDQEPVYLGLIDRGTTGLLADVDQLALRCSVREYGGGDEAIVNDHVRPRDQVERAPGRKTRIARPGADQVNDSALVVRHDEEVRSSSVP